MEVPGRIAFLRYCHEELLRERTRESIGLLAEKRLHSVLKRWVCPDLSCHEMRILAEDGTKGYAVADVCTGEGEIAEIQTGKLYPLRKKMEFYMAHTAHRVTVVHPLAAEKYVSWLDPATGEVAARNRSPKKQTPLAALGQLKPFVHLLGAPRFEVWLPALVMDEYRLLDGRDASRKRHSHRYELMPQDLLGVTVLRTRADYEALFPLGVPACFTAGEFARLTHLGRGYNLYDVLAVFCHLGVIEKGERAGRSYVYYLKKSPHIC